MAWCFHIGWYEVTKSRGILTPRKRWSGDELACLHRDYPDKSAHEIAVALAVKIHVVYAMAKKLGLRKSAMFLAGERSGRLTGEEAPGKQFRFRKGGPSPREGKPFPTRGRMGLTQFKKGHMPHNARFRIGDRRINSEGYLDRKISTDRKGALNWKAEHRLIWIEANGPIPDGHVVAFKPGRRTTDLRLITLDALELVTLEEHMRRHTVHNLPKELVQVIQLKGALQRQINKREQDAKQNR